MHFCGQLLAAALIVVDKTSKRFPDGIIDFALIVIVGGIEIVAGIRVDEPPVYINGQGYVHVAGGIGNYQWRIKLNALLGRASRSENKG